MRVLLFALCSSISLVNAGVYMDSACREANSQAVRLFEQDGGNDGESILGKTLMRFQESPDNALCIGITLDNLAAFAQRSGRLDEAEKYAKLAIHELEKDPRTEPVIVRPLEILIGVYLERRLPGRAKPLLERLEALPDIGITDKAIIHGLRADILLGLGDFSAAEREYLATLQDWASGPLDNRVRAVPEQINLACLYIRTGRYGEAESLLNRALETMKGQAADPDGETIQILNSFAYLFVRQGKVQAAEESLRTAFQLSHRFPVTPGMNAQLYRNYAAILRAAHRKSEAREFDAKAQVLEGPTNRATVDITQLAIKPGAR